MLRTRSPLIPGPKPGSPFDLHVLSTPPAFVLSQDQTLRREMKSPRPKARGFVSVLESAGREQALPWPAFLTDPARNVSGRFQYYLVSRGHGEPAPRDGV